MILRAMCFFFVLTMQRLVKSCQIFGKFQIPEIAAPRTGIKYEDQRVAGSASVIRIQHLAGRI
jgi:hypothetical protein